MKSPQSAQFARRAAAARELWEWCQEEAQVLETAKPWCWESGLPLWSEKSTPEKRNRPWLGMLPLWEADLMDKNLADTKSLLRETWGQRVPSEVLWQGIQKERCTWEACLAYCVGSLTRRRPRWVTHQQNPQTQNQWGTLSVENAKDIRILPTEEAWVLLYGHRESCHSQCTRLECVVCVRRRKRRKRKKFEKKADQKEVVRQSQLPWWPPFEEPDQQLPPYDLPLC